VEKLPIKAAKARRMKKRSEKRKEERFTMHASLCGGSDLLKALGNVAHSLAGSIFYSTNDKKRGRIFLILTFVLRKQEK